MCIRDRLEYRTVEITPAIGQIDIFQKTGQKKLPVLFDKETTIHESSLIIRYLEKIQIEQNLISEGIKNTWRHKMTTFTAVFSLFLALYFVGILAIAGENTRTVLQYLRSKYKIEVFFKQDIDFVFLNVDNTRWQEIIDKYEVNGIPQLNFFDSNGDFYGTSIGLRNYDELNQLVEALYRNQPFPKFAGTGSISTLETEVVLTEKGNLYKSKEIDPRSHG